MPSALRIGSYRFFFYTSDRDESIYVHVERDDKIAKVWLDPIRLQSSGGFGAFEIRQILRIVDEHQPPLVGAWNEYFGK